MTQVLRSRSTYYSRPRLPRVVAPGCDQLPVHPIPKTTSTPCIPGCFVIRPTACMCQVFPTVSRVITEIAQCTRLRRKPGQTTPTQVLPPLSTSPVTHSSSVAIPLDNSPVGTFWSPRVLESHSMIRFLAFCRWSDSTNSCQHHTYTELVLGLHVGLTRPGLPWPHREGAKLLPCPSQASCYCVNSPGTGRQRGIAGKCQHGQPGSSLFAMLSKCAPVQLHFSLPGRSSGSVLHVDRRCHFFLSV